MAKNITLSGSLLEKFHAKFGSEVDPNKFYVISARSISNEPITQNTIFNGAVLSKPTLYELADKVNLTDENIGVLTMHNNTVLNVGRVFFAEVESESPEFSSLTAYLAILRGDDTEGLISKIENCVLDEVSIGFTARHAYCSKCDFDYMGPDSSFENWWEQTCPEGHKIGEDGCHLKLDGVLSFSEISIVNRGAANGAKIKKMKDYSREDFQRFAASGEFPDNFNKLTFSQKMERKMSDNIEDKKIELSAEEKAAKLETELAEVRKQLDLSEKVKELETKLSEAEAKVEALTTEKEELEKKAEADVEEVKSQVEQVTTEKEEISTELSSFKTFLKDEVSKVMTASGVEGDVPEDLAGMSELLGKGQNILASLIPVGGVAATKTSGSKDLKLTEADVKAYRVKQ